MSEQAMYHWQVTFTDADGLEQMVYVHAETDDDAIKAAKRTHRKEAKKGSTVTAYPLAEVTPDSNLLTTKQLRDEGHDA